MSTMGVMIASVSRELIVKIVEGAASRPDIMETPQYKQFKEMYDLEGETVLSISIMDTYRGQVYLAPVAFSVALNEAGALVPNQMIGKSDSLTDIESSQILSHNVSPAFFALAMCHCKNVKRRDVTDEVGPSVKWIRRQKAPAIKYYTLDINPMKEVLRTEGGIEHNGLKKALHICRGHFATYTGDKPLFGNITGTFWKPSHVRGDMKHGTVVKDYAIKLSTEGQQ